MTQLYLLYFCSLLIFIAFVLLCVSLYAYVTTSYTFLTATWGTLSLTFLYLCRGVPGTSLCHMTLYGMDVMLISTEMLGETRSHDVLQSP